MLFIGILWNTINDLKKDCIKDIMDHSNLLDCIELDLGDCYEEFVKDVYACDGILEERLTAKVASMQNCNCKKIVLFFISETNPTQEYNARKKRQVYSTIENLKQYIRNKYQNNISNYYFDNILHITDDSTEVNNLFPVLYNWFPEKKDYFDELQKVSLQGVETEKNLHLVGRWNNGNQQKKD